MARLYLFMAQFRTCNWLTPAAVAATELYGRWHRRNKPNETTERSPTSMVIAIELYEAAAAAVVTAAAVVFVVAPLPLLLQKLGETETGQRGCCCFVFILVVVVVAAAGTATAAVLHWWW